MSAITRSPVHLPDPETKVGYLRALATSGYVAAVLRPNIIFNGSRANPLANATVTLTNKGTVPLTLRFYETDNYASGARTLIASPSVITPGGTVKTTVNPTKTYVEIRSTSGSGPFEADITALTSWDQVGFTKNDPFANNAIVN